MISFEEIEIYIDKLVKEEEDFKKNRKSIVSESELKKNVFTHYITVLKVFLVSVLDFFYFHLLLVFKPTFFRNKHIVFTLKNFCSEDEEGKLSDRLLTTIINEDIIFINYGKDYVLKRINGQRVFNFGGLVKLISFFAFNLNSKRMKIFKSYRIINNSILKKFKETNVYTLCFYDLNGLSLSFSKFRNRFNLIEIQHGSIINYPPYSKPSPIKMADLFYVKNSKTVEFLKERLNQNFLAEYKLIPYPKSSLQYESGINILYASTVEFNGFHPVFLKFLETVEKQEIKVKVRLHPREKEKVNVFERVLKDNGVKYEFDDSRNWIESNKIKNLIIISPWSSVIEDSYDNGFTTIIIDEVGEKRFKHLIDNKRCFYSDDITKTLSKIEIKD